MSKRENDRFRLIFEQSSSFSALLEGPEHRFVLCNPAYLKLIGQRDVIGLTVREALPEIEGQGFLGLLDRVFETGEPYVGEAVEVELQNSPSGARERRRVDFVYQPLRNKKGVIDCILVHGSDVTDAADANDVLRASELRLTTSNAELERMVEERSSERGTTWQVSPHLLSVIDMSTGRFIRVSPSWAAQLGWSEAEMTGAPYVDFVHADDLAGSAAAFDQVQRGEPVLNFENRYRSKLGGYEWLSWVAVPDGDRLYSTARVVSAEKRQSESLAKAETALRQSQKMEAVGQLAGGIAHDFNNMLAVIIGAINLIERRQGTDKPIDDLLASAREAAERSASLTQRLLAFSRQLPLDPQTVNVAVMVKSMSELLQRTLGEEVRIETVLSAGLWNARTDANQLENAILNLSVNARDAMPEGGKLTIETSNAHIDDAYAREHSEVTSGQYVLIAVSDTGVGMAPDVLRKAFDPFFTTKDVGKGTGLGLSQVFGYVKQSGGHITLYSEPGKGTTVKIYLPRAFETDEVKLAPRTGATPSGARSEVILVVEDEPRMREIATAALRELGYTVLDAPSARRALEILDAHPEITLLFTDIVMPDMNGRQLADLAKAARPDLKVIFTTGYTRNAVVHHGVLDPGVNFLTKPYTLDQLGSKIREVLG